MLGPSGQSVVEGRLGSQLEPTAVQLRTITVELAHLKGRVTVTLAFGGGSVRHRMWITIF